MLSFTSAPVEPETGEDQLEGAAANSRGEEGRGARIGGRVDSREDVVKAIDAICDYYRRREPASPVFQLMQRAREWVPLDFLALLEDMAPGSVEEVKRILVAKPREATAQSSGW